MMVNPYYKQEWFLAVLGSVLTFLGYVAKGFWDSRKTRRKQKKEAQVIDGMRAAATVYSCMQHIKELNGIGRVFLLEVSDSGRIPKPGNPLYARGIEVYIDKNEIIDITKGENWNKKQYGELEVDGLYLNMVIRAKESQEPYIFKVSDHPDCILKDIYQEQGIKYAEIWHIYSDVNEWKEYILSIARYDSEMPFGDSDIHSMIVNNIRQIRYNFKKYR